MGQRTKKSNSSSTTWFIYDENDNVIAEYDATGNLVDEYVYMDNRPLALIRSSNLYYIYTDHLNTPRAITDTSNALQWTWENKEAFGNNAPVEIVSGFKFNFRLPGQYFDTETNLNYNIHRDYNPVWARYVQSDPLGLAAGINTYGYVGGNGLGSSDKLGLLKRDKNGNLIFKPLGYTTIGKNKIKTKIGYLFTDMGTSIIAQKRIENNPLGLDYTADCHGWSFANGQFWIDDDQVDKVLLDEYKIINSNQVREGDVIIYTDHLNTPRAITDTANVLQWAWENKEAFGNNLPTEVVTGFKFNFRLPGQYFDIETNLNYNIHRDYNPVWGRYMSSDPLGLAAGINTYGYVYGDGLGAIDRLGLSPRDIELITNIYNQSITNMIKNGNRLPGKSTYRAWLNNFEKAYWNEKLYDCADQATNTIINLRKVEYKNKFYDDNWIFDLVESSTWHPGHYVIRAISSNPKDSLIILDPWRAGIPELFPNNSSKQLRLKSETVSDPTKPVIIKIK